MRHQLHKFKLTPITDEEIAMKTVFIIEIKLYWYLYYEFLFYWTQDLYGGNKHSKIVDGGVKGGWILWEWTLLCDPVVTLFIALLKLEAVRDSFCVKVCLV